MNFIFILLVPIAVIGANEIGPCDVCQVVAHLLQYPEGGAYCKSTGACKEAVLSEKCQLVDKMVANGLATVLQHHTNPDASKSIPGEKILSSVRRHLLREHEKCHQIGASNAAISKDDHTVQCIECTLLVEVFHFVFDTILGGPVEDALKQTLYSVCNGIPPIAGLCQSVVDKYTIPIFAGLRDSLSFLYSAVGSVLSPNGFPCPSPECVEALCYDNQLSPGCGWGG